jgi:hypothetical protein
VLWFASEDGTVHRFRSICLARPSILPLKRSVQDERIVFENVEKSVLISTCLRVSLLVTLKKKKHRHSCRCFFIGVGVDFWWKVDYLHKPEWGSSWELFRKIVKTLDDL